MHVGCQGTPPRAPDAAGPDGVLEPIDLIADGSTVRVLPGCGAKVVALISPSGRDWLWHDPYRPVRPPVPDATFADFDLSGWDECFPTISPCNYPGDASVRLPDHGELWSRPWSVLERSSHDLLLELQGVALAYRFQRRIAVDNHSAHVEYHLENLASSELFWLWSAHPMLAIEKGMRIHLSGSPKMTKEFGFGGRIGYDGADGSAGRFGLHRWPLVTGKDGLRRDLGIVDFPDPPVTDKVVVRHPDSGWVALCTPGGESLRIEFDPNLLPYLGICANLGAWPFKDRPGRWLALEPTNGGTDRLDDAVKRGEAARLEPGGITSWWLTFSFTRCSSPMCRHD